MIVDDRPFPLLRRFRRRIVPGLLAFVLLLVGLTALAAREVMREIYLDLAQRRADVIARAVSAAAPEAWTRFLDARLAADDADALSAALRRAFAAEVEQLGLVKLKVYDLERRTIYSTQPEGIGKVEAGAALRGVIEQARSSAVAVTEPDGAELYELYVPLIGPDGKVQAVFELYEPIDRLNAILARAARMPVIVPGVLMAALVLALWHLVRRAQGDIDARTDALNTLRRRLETFMSASAQAAARGTGPDEAIPSRKVALTLLYSDVRGFTGYAESNPPEAVVGFLNRLMAIQVGAVRRHDGDVDKLIGDAVLARFDGAGAPARAIAAARAIHAGVEEAGLPRRVGIGVYSGEVISGAIGPAERRDFTVIGDSVNIAARLCAAAAAGETVADAASVAAAADAGFGPAEALQVKGRSEKIAVRRSRATAEAPRRQPPAGQRVHDA